MSQALALVAGPVLFGFLGYLIDHALGTGAVFTVGLAIFGIAGAILSQYYQYMARVRRQDEGRPWTRRRFEQ